MSKQQTLLERAKTATSATRKVDRKYTAEEIALVKAWLAGAITGHQVKVALGPRKSGYVFLAIGAREIWKKQRKMKKEQGK